MSDKQPEGKTNPANSEGAGSKKKGRSAAEWTTLAVSIVVVLTLAGLVVYQYFTEGTAPPIIEVKPVLEQVRHEGETYYIPVEVTNSGEQTAESVEVQLSLSTGESQPETTGFTIQFLAGKETHHQTAAFQNDPAQGTLEHTITFATP
jgi:uncharacterized protein (TIGR02588 family)